MTRPQIIKAASLGQILLGGIILIVQVAALVRGRSVKPDVGSATSA